MSLGLRLMYVQHQKMRNASDIIRRVKKAYESAVAGATVVCLLPARTDTKWFQEYCLKSRDIRFIRGRLRFVGAKNSAPFPSVVVVFSPASLRGEEKHNEANP